MLQVLFIAGLETELQLQALSPTRSGIAPGNGSPTVSDVMGLFSMVIHYTL